MYSKESTVKLIVVGRDRFDEKEAVDYISSAWSWVPRKLYEDSVAETVRGSSPLPQWYLLEKSGRIIGCTGLVSHDFTSRPDLSPWICAVYVSDEERGNGYASLMLERAADDCAGYGFEKLYLTTEMTGFYEKYGYLYLCKDTFHQEEPLNIYYLDVKSRSMLGTGRYIIRPEREEELDTVYSLIRTAFATASVSDGDEQDFAVTLRESRAYIPSLALVVESEGELIAHIMLTGISVETAQEPHEALLLAPVSVLPAYQKRGVGSMLITQSLKRAAKMGYGSVFLCGDPEYYGRFGFRSISEFGLSAKGTTPLRYMLALELTPGALEGISGTVDYC